LYLIDERMKMGEGTREHPVACFITKQDRLGFSSFASKLAKKRWRVVHMALSRRSRKSEAKNGRFNGVGCGAMEVVPNYPLLDVFSF
jgi:hypothetical protein